MVRDLIRRLAFFILNIMRATHHYFCSFILYRNLEQPMAANNVEMSWERFRGPAGRGPARLHRVARRGEASSITACNSCNTRQTNR